MPKQVNYSKLPGPIQKRSNALSTKYHASLGWDEWIPELTKKYKLKLFG
jgi:hypothetical protein